MKAGLSPLRETGAVVIAELLMWTVVLSLVLAVVVYSGREPLVQGQLDRAAKAAVEEAAAHRTKTAARAAAHVAALANLAQDGIRCRGIEVELDLTDWRPGGIIRADVTCDVDLSDLVAIGLPVGVPMSSWFLAAIDSHKELL